MAEDCGFYLTKLGGLFSKFTHEEVPVFQSRWITDGWFGLDLGEREKEVVAGTVAPAARHHCRRQGGHRRTWNSAYGPRFEEPRAPGERGGEGELAKADTAAGGESRDGGRHGRRPKLADARE